MGLWMDWRWISGVCTIEPIFFLIGLTFVPESPYYLVKKGQLNLLLSLTPSIIIQLNYTGRQSDANIALIWLRGSRYNVKKELHQIQSRVDNDSIEASQLSDISRPWNYKPVMIGVILMTLQQFSGMNGISFNAAEIFRIANLNLDRLIGVVLINFVQVFDCKYLALIW